MVAGLAALVGASLITAGFWLVSPAVGLIVGGSILLGAAVAYERGGLEQ